MGLLLINICDLSNNLGSVVGLGLKSVVEKDGGAEDTPRSR